MHADEICKTQKYKNSGRNNFYFHALCYAQNIKREEIFFIYYKNQFPTNSFINTQ